MEESNYIFGRKIKRKEVLDNSELMEKIISRANDNSNRSVAEVTAAKRYVQYINNMEPEKWSHLYNEEDASYFPAEEKTNKPQVNMDDIEIKIVKMKDQEFDSELFVPIKSETPIDKLISNKEGLMPATNTIILGDPGIGKTTVMLDLLSNIKQNNPQKRVLFVSGEMNAIDLAEYMERLPGADELDIFFTMDYEENCHLAFQKVLNQGWDVILLDSFDEVKESLNEGLGLSGTKAEKWLIDLMVQHNLANNEREINTSFLAIQQVTKGGKFVGSNKLKHNTTAMLEIRFDKVSKHPKLFYTKNRRGNIDLDMFFEITNDGVEYDITRFKREQEFRSQIEFDKKDEEKETRDFAAIFNLEEDEEGNFTQIESVEDENDTEVENAVA